MTKPDLDRIEQQLGIKLPTFYRELMLHRREELANCTYEEEERLVDWFADRIYERAERIIKDNLDFREPDMGVADAFPDWWKTFFIIGTNGGGDFYCIKLDGTQGLWMIGTDCGSNPVHLDESFDHRIDEELNNFRVEKEQLPHRIEYKKRYEQAEKWFQSMKIEHHKFEKVHELGWLDGWVIRPAVTVMYVSNATWLQKAPGVFVIVDATSRSCQPLDGDESDNVNEGTREVAMDKTRSSCWIKHAKGDLFVAAIYFSGSTQPQRQRILKQLKEATRFVCDPASSTLFSRWFGAKQ